MPSSVRAAPSEQDAETLAHQERFKVFNEMYMVRGFRLVLCAEVCAHSEERVPQVLERVVEAERVNGGFDYLPREPLFISERQSGSLRTGPVEYPGPGGDQGVITFAL